MTLDTHDTHDTRPLLLANRLGKQGDARGGAKRGGNGREDADQDLDDPAEGFFLHKGRGRVLRVLRGVIGE